MVLLHFSLLCINKWRGQIEVWSPITNQRSAYLVGENIKLNDIEMSSDGKNIIFAGRDQVCKYSTDYGVNWTDVPILDKGGCCSVVGNKFIIVDYDLSTKTILSSNDAGVSWSSSTIETDYNFNDVAIHDDQYILVGDNGRYIHHKMH